MQVRSPQQIYHQSPVSPDQPNLRTNNALGSTRPQYPGQITGSSPDEGMDPYQHSHASGGHGATQPQSRYLPHTQQQRTSYSHALPPMHSSHMPIPPAFHSQQYGVPLTMPSYPYPNNPYSLQTPSAIAPPVQQAAPAPPQNVSSDNGKYKFEIRVEQQPQRARMCGFGDKDRRPITPPPCIRLVITDLQSGAPVDVDDIDCSFFVLQVDLWNEVADREVNIVRASTNSPGQSISSATTTSFPPTPERSMLGGEFGPGGMMYPSADGQSMMPMGAYSRGSIGGGGGFPYGVGYPPQTYGSGSMSHSSSHGSQQYTRNLIGSLTVNASRLKDTNDSEDFWFVLQDLSVRTEGNFRLKMNFIDLGIAPSSLSNSTGTNAGSSSSGAAAAGGGGSSNTLNRGRCVVLASAFSDPFQVYSAKKFPGVIESTPLSKCFAQQGIKIPIRKDVKGERDGDDGDD